MVEIVLAHPLSAHDVEVLGLPPGEYGVGDTITTDPETALRLVQAGLTTINPSDRDAVEAIRTGLGPLFVTGRWYVNLAREVVDLADVRSDNRIPTEDVYRIERRRDGVILAFLWAQAGVQITDTVLTAAEQSVSAGPVPQTPTPNDLVTGGGGGGGGGEAYIDPAAPSVLVVTLDAETFIDPADPFVLVRTV